MLPEECQIHKPVPLFCSTSYTCVFVEPYKKEMKKRGGGCRRGGKETDCFAIAWHYLSSTLSGVERRQQFQSSSGFSGCCSRIQCCESDVNNYLAVECAERERGGKN